MRRQLMHERFKNCWLFEFYVFLFVINGENFHTSLFFSDWKLGDSNCIGILKLSREIYWTNELGKTCALNLIPKNSELETFCSLISLNFSRMVNLTDQVEVWVLSEWKARDFEENLYHPHINTQSSLSLTSRPRWMENYGKRRQSISDVDVEIQISIAIAERFRIFTDFLSLVSRTFSLWKYVVGFLSAKYNFLCPFMSLKYIDRHQWFHPTVDGSVCIC